MESPIWVKVGLNKSKVPSSYADTLPIDCKLSRCYSSIDCICKIVGIISMEGQIFSLNSHSIKGSHHCLVKSILPGRDINSNIQIYNVLFVVPFVSHIPFLDKHRLLIHSIMFRVSVSIVIVWGQEYQIAMQYLFTSLRLSMII